MRSIYATEALDIINGARVDGHHSVSLARREGLVINVGTQWRSTSSSSPSLRFLLRLHIHAMKMHKQRGGDKSTMIQTPSSPSGATVGESPPSSASFGSVAIAGGDNASATPAALISVSVVDIVNVVDVVNVVDDAEDVDDVDDVDEIVAVDEVDDVRDVEVAEDVEVVVVEEVRVVVVDVTVVVSVVVTGTSMNATPPSQGEVNASCTNESAGINLEYILDKATPSSVLSEDEIIEKPWEVNTEKPPVRALLAHT